MAEVTITVPMAPPRALLPNVRRKGKGGAHWSVQSEATSELRFCAKIAAMAYSHAVRFDGPVIVSYAVVWPRERYGARKPIPDPDAIPSAAKAILDGFVDAGLLLDDSSVYVDEVRARGRRGAQGEDGATVVTITEAAAEAEAA